MFFKTNPLPLKDLIKNIGELNARTILAGVGLDGIYVKLKQITDQSIATAMSLNIFGKSTNLPIEGAQRFANAVAQLGGNSQEAMNDLARLQMRLINMKRLGQPDDGLTGANYWLRKVGAPIQFGGTDPIKLIDRMRVGFQRLKREEQLLVLQSLGLSQSSALYLRMTDDQWEAQKKNMASSQEQINTIKNMGGEWRKLSQVLNQLGMDLTEQTSPALAQLARVMSDNLAVMERGGVFKTLAEWMGNLALMADALGISIEKIGEAMFKIHDKFSITLPSVAGMTGAGASMTQQNTITIAVNGAESGPAGIAQQIAREIEHALKTAMHQDGGKRL